MLHAERLRPPVSHSNHDIPLVVASYVKLCRFDRETNHLAAASDLMTKTRLLILEHSRAPDLIAARIVRYGRPNEVARLFGE